MPKRKTTTAVDPAAAAWAARLDGGPLSADERAALEAWTASDARRAGALARALAVMDRVDRAAAAGIEDKFQGD